MTITHIGIVLLLLLMLIPTSNATEFYDQRTDHYDILLYSGSTYEFSQNDKSTHFIKFKYSYQRRVQFELFKDGNLINRAECYKNNICYLGNVKIIINTVFYGREAHIIIFDILKVYVKEETT